MSRWTLPLAAVVGVLLGVIGTIWYSSSFGERGRTERIVHEYVLDHPELIPQAMQRLKDQESGKVIAANRDAILKPFSGAWAGNPNGNLTIVEYLDYNCGYCRASLPIIAKLIASDPQLKVVYRDLPILSEESAVAARMSLAAAAQGKFQAFHDALYAAGPLSDQTIAQAAAKAGVDTNKAAAMTQQAEAEIAKNVGIARQLGLTGTPSWVIGDRVVSAMMSLEDMQKAIADARRG